MHKIHALVCLLFRELPASGGQGRSDCPVLGLSEGTPPHHTDLVRQGS